MDEQRVRVDPGASVEATDGLFGMVDQVIVRPETGELAYLVVQRGWGNHQYTIPADLIAAVPSRREVRLRVTRDEAREAGATRPGDQLLATDHGDELHIPVAEERLIVGKQLVDLGELRIHKRVERREERARQQVTRDDLQVERVAINRQIDAPLEPRMEDEWLVIPIMEEVLVVEKRLMLTEEVRIRKRQLTEEQEVRDLLRYERIELEDATVYGVGGLRAADATTRLDVMPEPRADGAPDAPDGQTEEGARDPARTDQE